MRRHQDIDSLVALLVLLTVTGSPVPPTPTADLVFDQKPARIEAPVPPRRCAMVDVPEAGRYWLTLRSDRPSTAPALMVLAIDGADPRTTGRVEGTLLNIAQPGTHIVCFTSDADPGHGGWSLDKAGDPLEIIEEIDPATAPSTSDHAGDPLEIIEVIDP